MLKTQTKSATIAIALLVSLFTISTPVLGQEESTSSVRDLVREKVKEKLQILSKKPKASIGVLVQPSENSLELSSQEGKKIFVSTTEETKYFRVAKDNKQKEIKFDELAIGEFVVAMGYMNDKDILEARRVVTYEVNPLGNKLVAHGTVTAVTRNSLTLKHPKKDETTSVKVTAKTSVTTQTQSSGVEKMDFSDIEEGDRVIAIGVSDKTGALDATKIHVIPGEAKGLEKETTPTPTASE